MRLRTLAAPTMAEAMEKLRRELGMDAIIVSSESDAQGARIVAALDEPEPALAGPGAMEGERPGSAEDPIDAVHEALLAHGVPNRLVERLVDASFLAGRDEPLAALADALAAIYAFHPLGERRPNQALMLLGTPGAGKTMTTAKLAARIVLERRKVRLITTDSVRSGAVEQLAAYAELLGAPFASAEDGRQLAEALAAALPDETVLIDTAGINPFSPREFGELSRLVHAVSAEPVLVSPAGGDVVDAAEQAQRFAELGVTRLIATRLDLARRLGGLLAAADGAGLALAEYGMSPAVADGLGVFDPVRLARMLLPEPSLFSATQSAKQGTHS